MPTLHPRCHVIPIGDGLLLRRGAQALVVEDPSRAAQVRAVLDWLAGQGNRLAFADLPPALQIIDELDAAGLLVHRAAESSAAAESPAVTPLQPAFHGRAVATSARVVVVGKGPAARAAAGALAAQGLTVAEALTETETETEGGNGDEERADLVIACPAGPDLARLEAINRAAVAGGSPVLPAFLLGDLAIVGPVGAATGSACLRCWELRWLGLSLSITTERAYLDHLRAGGWRAESTGSTVAAEWVGEQAAVLGVNWLDDPGTFDGHVLVADFTTGTATRHAVVRHPDCDVCSPKGLAEPTRSQAVAAWDGWRHDPAEEVDPLELDRQLDHLVDRRTGLVADVDDADPAGPEGHQQGPAGPEGQQHRLEVPGLFVTALTRFALPHPNGIRRDTARITHGAADSAQIARCLARVEGLERYCGQARPKPSARASYEDLSPDALCPSDLPLFSESQYRQPGFPHPRWQPHLPMDWVWGYNLHRECAVALPQDAVRYFGPRRSLVDETSSGVAAHSTRNAALASAVLELVERDAFMIHWLNRLSPPQLDLDGLAPGFACRAVAVIGQAGYRPVVVDLTTDLQIPVFLAMAWRDDGMGPALRIGAGCDLWAPRALDKALHELLGAVTARSDQPWAPAEPLGPGDVARLHDHGEAYSHPSWLPRAAFLWASPDVRRLEDLSAAAGPPITADAVLPSTTGARPPVTADAMLPSITGARPSVTADAGLPSTTGAGPHATARAGPPATGGTAIVAHLVEHLGAHDLELIAADLTTADVAGSLHVVRAIVPGLQPIGFGRHGLRLGGRRLYEAPVAMGYRNEPTTEASLNRNPLCFP
jgi:ribosomal protein S12 methylthiotransferase accessory factor